MSSCPQPKVRTYACGVDGTRLIKYVTSAYDFKKEKCNETIKPKKVKCDPSAVAQPKVEAKPESDLKKEKAKSADDTEDTEKKTLS